MDEKKIYRWIVSVLTRELAPERIIVFGSRSNGTATEESDLDILVILESDLRPHKRDALVSSYLCPRPVAMDILVRTPAEIKARLEKNDFFIKDILQNGLTIYERSAGKRMD